MEIVLKHWTDENLKSPSKSINAPTIKRLTGVENYKGRASQIQEIMGHITVDNYFDMYHRVMNLETDDSITGSSNFGKFIEFFSSDNSSWIEKTNVILEM